MKPFIILVVGWFALTSVSVHAHKAHRHGHGNLSIAQEAQSWLVEFTLPAADLLGFEHQPQTDAELEAAAALKKQAQDFRSLFTLAADCQQQAFDLSLPKDDKGHSDLRLTYELTCASVPSAAQVVLFDWASDVKTLDTQWLTAQSTGSKTVTADNARLGF